MLVQPVYLPQQPRLRRRQMRLRLTMVITTGTREAVIDTVLQLIGPVYVVSYSLQPQAEGVTCSISYWPGMRPVMTSGSSSSVQLPARRVKISPVG